MATILNTVFRLKRGTSARWEEVNPILQQGEPGFILDENRLKIGDGITPWNNLPYLGESNVFSGANIKDFPEVGQSWTIYKSTEDKKLYQWNEETACYEELMSTSIVQTHTYEVFSKPEGTLVNIQEDEIRIMCGKDTSWQLQSSGANADPNAYYIGLKIYAPNDEIYSFKEDLNAVINDPTLYHFTDNEFAGIDEDGRKFSIVWLPVAAYSPAADSWTYHGEKSSTKKYIGWDYCVEWYNQDDKLVAMNSIRINLSNEECHYNNEPYYMSSINVNKLTQDEGTFLVLYGGSATDNI